MKRKINYLIFITIFFISFFITAQLATAQTELVNLLEKLADKLTSSSSGQVIDVEENLIYINLGEKDSVHPGSMFEVIRLGDNIMVDGKAYPKEYPIGEIEITKVRHDMSYGKAISGSSDIKKGNKVYQIQKNIKRIVLFEFPDKNSFNTLTKNVYESLSVLLNKKGIQIVERSQLDKVIHEHKISYSGIVDISTVQKLGKLVSAEGAILGSIGEQGNNMAIRAQLVDVGKGLAITSDQIFVTKVPEIDKMRKTNSRDIGIEYKGSAVKSSSAIENAKTEIDQPMVILTNESWKTFEHEMPGWNQLVFNDNYWINSKISSSSSGPDGMQDTKAKWIWHPDMGHGFPKFFRNSFSLTGKSFIGKVRIGVHGKCTLFINGIEICKVEHSEATYCDVSSSLKAGNNIIAIQAYRTGGLIGIIADFKIFRTD